MPAQYRHTKIVGTIGPATESREHLEQLIVGGIDVMRLNMAHGTSEWVASLVGRIREVSAEVTRHVAVMMDVKGPEIRTGVVAGLIDLEPGDLVLRALLDTLGSKARIIAKIEDQSGLRNLDAIVRVADAVMVARGDLGIEIEYHVLPLVQRRIVDTCLSEGKPVIIATHLLESMIFVPMPTRAEISDVSNAVRERADAVMLSGETKTGAYPLECVKVLRNIIGSTEPSETRGLNESIRLVEPKAKMLRSAAVLAQELGNSGIVVFTRSGFLAYTLAALRAVGVPIYAFTDDEALFRQMLLPWGVEPFLMAFQRGSRRNYPGRSPVSEATTLVREGHVAGCHHQRARPRQGGRYAAAPTGRLTCTVTARRARRLSPGLSHEPARRRAVAERRLCLFLVAVTLNLVQPLASGQGARPVARPNFDGIWNSATATPLERPSQLGNKAFFTPEEAATWERRVAESNEEPSPEAAARSTGTGTYNTFFREFGTRISKTLRTSIVTDPSDGRIPALTPAAAETRRRRLEDMRGLASAQDAGLQDQCLAFVTAGPPMLPYSYNSNYQIVQTADAVVVRAEMLGDARIIRLDGRPHLPPTVRRWMGDSVGRWDGPTLVVDTTNFNDADGFYGDAGGNFGWDRNLHVVERFSLLDADTVLYRFDVDDPTAFTKPWKGELTMSRSLGHIYEYACHEGNYSLPNMLRGYRVSERNANGPR